MVYRHGATPMLLPDSRVVLRLVPSRWWRTYSLRGWYGTIAVDDAGIPALEDAIRHLHGCESRHVETAHVRELHEGLVVWESDGSDVFPGPSKA
jgi:hypothetical protein